MGVEMNPNTITCPVCDRSFTIRGLRRHRDHAHPGTPLTNAYTARINELTATIRATTNGR